MKEKKLAPNTNHTLNRRIFDLKAQGYSYSMIQAQLIKEGMVEKISTATIGTKLRSEGLKKYYYGTKSK